MRKTILLLIHLTCQKKAKTALQILQNFMVQFLKSVKQQNSLNKKTLSSFFKVEGILDVMH